jgi:hypothetical protein
MKKVIAFITGLCCLLLSFCASAQDKTGADYFEGKWNMLLKGTPNGDAKLTFIFEKKDSLLTGTVLDSTGKEVTKFDKIELEATKATVYFNIQGYDVNIAMDKKDDDHIAGSLMGMFDV